MKVDHRPPPWSKGLRRALSVLVGVMALICASAQQAAFSQETAPAISGHQREAPSVQHQTPENNKTSLTGKKLLRTIIVDNYYPYTFVNDKGGPDGFSVDLLKAVATILGMEVQIDVDVWEEAREGLNSGEIDFLPMMAYSEERDRYFDFSVPHSISYDAIFTRKKSPSLRSLRNLKDKKIIVMNNDQSHDYLRSLDFISEDNLILINDLKDALRMLASGKGDAALMPKLVGLVFIDQLKLTNLELQPVMIEAYKRPFSIAVKNGNQELLERFNQGLTILKKTHRYDEIYEKWFGIVNPIGIPTKDIVRYVLLAVSAIAVVGGFVLVWIVVLHRTVRRRTMELGERVKELQCLFAVSELVGRLELSVDEALQLIANLIPPAWQYPEVTCARIFWGGREYLSRGFLETEWRLAGEVLAENNRVGTVEVYYLEEKPELTEGPFHAEERNLINALSATLGRFIERKRAEEVLRKQALVWEQMSEGVVVLDNDSLILDMNPAAEMMFGYSKDEMLGKRPSIWQKEDFVGKTADDIADGIRRDGHWSGETNVVRKDGSHRVFEANAVAAHDENGNLIGRVGVNRDITERKQSELALRESAAHLRSIMDNAPVSIILKDCEGRFLAANQAYLRTLVLAADQVIGKTTYSHNSKEIADEISSQERLVIETRSPRSFEVTRDSPNVGTRALVVVRFPVVTEDGAVIGVGAISFDVTDRNTLERQLVHAQKMEAVGQLTGGLAHDLNNALGIILMNVGMLNGNTDGTPSATECLNGITKGVNRAGKLTRKLLDFSRTDVGETKLVSVNKFVQGMGGLIAKSLTPAITLEIDLTKNVWHVEIDAGDLEDAILNLSLNAGDAMPDGGTLVIETTNKVIDQGYVDRNPEGAVGEFVMVSVSDTGTGMTPEALEKAFEPFFSTKDVGKGTGLGLSMVYGFVQRSGGHAKIYSVLGEGTTVRLYLPRVRGDEDAKTSELLDQNDLPGGDEMILVVDDEEELAEAAVSLLEFLGYRTTTAANGKEALEILKQGPAIDLLFSDIIMPGGMDGYQLAINALKDRSNLRVLLTSGFTRRREEFANGERKTTSELAKNLLHKPYNIAELAVAVRRTLDQGGK